jgi:hypothetical protein
LADDGREAERLFARIVNQAKRHALRLGRDDLADSLPHRQVKCAVDAILRLRQVLRTEREPVDATSPMTPAEVGQHLGRSVNTVLGWIHSGELRAVNLADRQRSRPRYIVEPDALAEFQRLRQTLPAVQRRRRRRAIRV